MLIDIAIVPPQHIRREIGTKMKKEIGHAPHLFVVDNNKLIPHVSLWHMRTSKIKIPKITRRLEKIIKGQKSIRVSSLEFHALEKYKGFLEFAVKDTNGLVLLQQRIFQNIHSYKTGAMPKFAPFLNIPYTKKAIREIKKYGRSLGFNPHFTMGWLKNEKDIAQVVRKMQKTKFSFLAKEIYVCEVDNWWQVKRIIRKIEF
jgi:hypothetical protein